MAEEVTDTMDLVTESTKHPHSAVGRFLRALREAKYKTQIEFGAASRIDNSQISKVERGEDVLVSTYVKYARALGYRGLLDVFRAPADPQLRKLLMLWRRLEGLPGAQTELLQLMKGFVEKHEE
jgi:transcriptional regulator with XRE-family HTH domain